MNNEEKFPNTESKSDSQKDSPGKENVNDKSDDKSLTDKEKLKHSIVIDAEIERSRKAKELEANSSYGGCRNEADENMAIDLPETIPSIINTFKRSNSGKAIQKLTKNLKSCDKSPKFSFFKSKASKTEQCRCSFPDCKECQNSNKNFGNNNEAENEPGCDQTLLGEVDLKSDLTFEGLNDWNLRENDGDCFSNKYWSNENGAGRKYLSKRRDDEALLDSSESTTKRRKKVFILSSLGVALLSCAIFIRLAEPVDAILNWKLTLAPDTMVLDLWKAPPVTVYVKIYIFNVTNPIEFLEKKEKLKVQELGPYVYTEHLENSNPIFHKNGTLSYMPKRRVKLRLDLTNGNPKLDYVTVPNIAFLGLASMIANSSLFTNLGFLTLTKYLGSQPFMNMTVHDYLWGYNDSLIKVANRVVASWIPFEKLGLMDRMYDEGENLVTIRLHDNGMNVTDKAYLPQFSIDSWNGSPGLRAWGYKPQDFEGRDPLRLEPEERCKFIRGATDGVIFPRNMNPNITHQVYRKTFCRIMPLEFSRKGVFDNGIPGYWYKLPDNVFDPPDQNPAQLCYCDPKVKECLPKGLSDLTPCYYNIPAAVSFPHFLGADPKLIEAVDGIHPDKKKHGSYIVLQPDLGMPMDFQTRIQTNIVMRKIKYNSKITPFSDITLPIFWVELSMDSLPAYLNFLLYLVVFVVPTLQTSLMVIGFVTGTSLIIYSAICWLLISGFIRYEKRSKNRYSAFKIAPSLNKANIVNLSRKNSIISVMNISRKSSLISNHKILVNEV